MTPAQVGLVKQGFGLFAEGGKVKVEGLAEAMRSLGANPSHEEITKMIAEVDEDGSGELETKELRKALHDLAEVAVKAQAAEKAQAKLVRDKRLAARAAQEHAKEHRAQMEQDRVSDASFFS